MQRTRTRTRLSLGFFFVLLIDEVEGDPSTDGFACVPPCTRAVQVVFSPAVLQMIEAARRQEPPAKYPYMRGLYFHNNRFNTAPLADKIVSDLEALRVRGALPQRVRMARVTNPGHHVKRAKGGAFCTAVTPLPGQRLVLGDLVGVYGGEVILTEEFDRAPDVASRLYGFNTGAILGMKDAFTVDGSRWGTILRECNDIRCAMLRHAVPCGVMPWRAVCLVLLCSALHCCAWRVSKAMAPACRSAIMSGHPSPPILFPIDCGTDATVMPCESTCAGLLQCNQPLTGIASEPAPRHSC